MDWKSLLERYMRAVVQDDHVVGLRCVEDVDGTAAEKQALAEVAHLIKEEYFSE